MKTRGVKRRATANAAGAGSTGSPAPSNITVASLNGSTFKVPNIPGWESRRRRRHLNIGEAIKKVMKKREAEAKASALNIKNFLPGCSWRRHQLNLRRLLRQMIAMQP
jgi:hypothetical protein